MTTSAFLLIQKRSIILRSGEQTTCFHLNDAPKLSSETCVAPPFSQYLCEEVVQNLDGSKPSIGVQERISLSCHTCSGSSSISQILTAQLHTQHLSLPHFHATTSSVDCLFSLQQRNNHVWSSCRYTRLSQKTRERHSRLKKWIARDGKCQCVEAAVRILGRGSACGRLSRFLPFIHHGTEPSKSETFPRRVVCRAFLLFTKKSVEARANIVMSIVRTANSRLVHTSGCGCVWSRRGCWWSGRGFGPWCLVVGHWFWVVMVVTMQ